MTVSLSAIQGKQPERINGKQTIWGCFAQHKRDSRKRNIAFELTFTEWLAVWESSGQLPSRGRKLGQYVMARFGDKGAYAIGNVKIISAAENHHEANIGSKRPKSAEHKRKQSEIMKGRPSPNKGRAMSEEQKIKLRKPKTEEWKQKLRDAYLKQVITGKRKLATTPKQVRQIRKLRGKKSGAAIGRKLNIPVHMVNGILRGKNYWWVE